MPLVEQIPFRKIPNQSRLFLDYVALAPAGLPFYQRPPTIGDLEGSARELTPALSFRREELALVLHRQNAAFGGGPASAAHIEELREPDGVAVVTGQQVGLFTGPLYTVYKAVTAIRLAAELRARGVRAIPVFWMDSEDHDLAEIMHATLLPAGAQARRVDFRTKLYAGAPEHPQPVGRMKIPATIGAAVLEFLAGLPEGPYKPTVAEVLDRAYRPGSTFAEAFARVLTWLLGDRGLVLFDPSDPEAKRLAGSVFLTSVRRADEAYARLLQRNGELERQGYHAQVALQDRSTLLFLNHEGERRAVTRDAEGFGLKNTEVVFSPDTLARMAEREPECFSPNVLLRPIVQDSLFPTAAYVAGPAEVAYFAQAHALYPMFGRPMPVIWPRSSFTLLEPEVSSAMAAHHLVVEDCFGDREHVVRKMLTARGDTDALSILNDLRLTLEREVGQLRPALVATDPSLGPALDTAGRKVSSHVDALKARFVHLEAKRNGALESVADYLLAHCRPRGNLQERELNVNHFFARFGPAFVEDIVRLAGNGSFGHGIVRLGPE